MARGKKPPRYNTQEDERIMLGRNGCGSDTLERCNVYRVRNGMPALPTDDELDENLKKHGLPSPSDQK